MKKFEKYTKVCVRIGCRNARRLRIVADTSPAAIYVRKGQGNAI